MQSISTTRGPEIFSGNEAKLGQFSGTPVVI